MYNNDKKTFPSYFPWKWSPFTIDQTADNCVCKPRQVIIEIIYGIWIIKYKYAYIIYMCMYV